MCKILATYISLIKGFKFAYKENKIANSKAAD